MTGEAETKLENLSMKPTQRIAKYLVEFTRLSTLTGWDNRALRHQFYCGLPARIKDEVSHVGKPNTLPELRTLALSIDNRYWEREEETCREHGGQSLEKKADNHKTRLPPPRQTRTTRISITKNPLLRTIPAHLTTTPKGKLRTWATSLEKTANSRPRNELVVSPIISAFSVEV